MLESMEMKWAEKIRKTRKLTFYRLGKILEISQQAVRLICGRTKTKKAQTGIDLIVLCKLRSISGRDWDSVGNDLDREYLPKDWKVPEFE